MLQNSSTISFCPAGAARTAMYLRPSTAGDHPPGFASTTMPPASVRMSQPAATSQAQQPPSCHAISKLSKTQSCPRETHPVQINLSGSNSAEIQCCRSHAPERMHHLPTLLRSCCEFGKCFVFDGPVTALPVTTPLDSYKRF